MAKTDLSLCRSRWLKLAAAGPLYLLFNRFIMRILIITALLITVILPTRAAAYLDPGMGSLLAQLIIGGVAGLAVILKLYWNKIKGFFVRRK